VSEAENPCNAAPLADASILRFAQTTKLPFEIITTGPEKESV
jgi:hypothetical protein